MNSKLNHIHEYQIRFSEVDSLGMVWHGNYVKLLEDGRESFGREFGLSYWEIYKHGFITPIVKLNIDYKKSLRYGDEVLVQTSFVDCEAAKILFEYAIFRKSNNELVSTAETMQVFLNLKGELHLTLPDFFTEWKKTNGII